MSLLHQLQLPNNVFSTLSVKLIHKYYTRVMAELPGSMLNYKESIRYGLFAIFCSHRLRIMIDQLADLLVKLTHNMCTSAENAINKTVLSEVKRVNGKFDILCKLATISLDNPTGMIQEKIYPEVGQETLKNLIKNVHSKGKWYEHQVNKKMHSLYSHANRNMLLKLLGTFSFQAQSYESQLLLDAIELIKKYQTTSRYYYPKNIVFPIKKVIPIEWLSYVISDGNGTKKIIKHHYEMAVLQELKKQLTCKMIWIEGAYRYRNPIDDLPKDFEERRDHYYALLGLPRNAEEFVRPKQQALNEYLKKLDDTILTNNKVTIRTKNNGHIKISPYEPQAEPVNLKKLHEAIKKEYGTINLIDILKEVLRYRLLLCLYAMGTNTGLKCISSANDNVDYADLRYVKRRFLTIDNVTCSSSEVGAMIKGILEHCSNMEIDKSYVDTHGQSLLAFGISEFLIFDLLPRLKNIHKQKLYFPSSRQRSEYKNLDAILKEPINWQIIVDYYDEAVKHIVALKLGTMKADVFVKRFSHENDQHPVYKAIVAGLYGLREYHYFPERIIKTRMAECVNAGRQKGHQCFVPFAY